MSIFTSALRYARLSIWRPAINALAPEPTDWCVPSLRHAPLDMQHLINCLGENTEFPRAGDLIIELVSDGMCVYVKREERYRVIQGKSPYASAICAENIDSRRAHIIHIFNLRRHATKPRVWFLPS